MFFLSIIMNLANITQAYYELFPGDLSGNKMQRQTPGVVFAATEIAGYPNAELLLFNEKHAHEIGLGTIENDTDRDFLNATALPENIKTYATAYAGHQFGNWAGQLGDGRAIFAGEITNGNGKITELQWKGAGATPYSRHADGRAVLRSTVREYLMSEAMHHLNIPTTRSLSISFSGEEVLRDIMYSGNPAYEKGAVMMRTAESFLRFGHFQLLAAQDDMVTLRKLADFTIQQYYPEIKAQNEEKYIEFFRQVTKRTADLVVEWYRVGFVHGVMNTDNMSVLGLTIDYGPFSFLDEYSLNFTPNTTDLPGRRYAFGNQAKVAQWNLWQLASALYPLINDAKVLEETLEQFSTYFWEKHDTMFRAKFGFASAEANDDQFFNEAQTLMETLEIDYTLFFVKLQEIKAATDIPEHFKDIFYRNLSSEEMLTFQQFIDAYQRRLSKNTISYEESQQLMAATNPKFILRNYLLFECINEITEGKKDLLNKLLVALENPYKEIYPEFSQKRPSIYNGQAGCSTLSCSS